MKRGLFSKLLFILIVNIFLNSCVTTDKQIIQKMMASSAKTIMTIKDTCREASCTSNAFLVDRTGKRYWFITASHCVASDVVKNGNVLILPYEIKLILRKTNGSTVSYPASVVLAGSQELGDDLAIIEAEIDEPIPIIPLGYADPQLNEDLLIVTSPLYFGNQLFRAYISLDKTDKNPTVIDGIWKGNFIFQVESALGHGFGSSGSAIISLKQKAIVGVAVGSSGNKHGHISIVAMPVSKIKKFLNKIKKGEYKNKMIKIKKGSLKGLTNYCKNTTTSTKSIDILF